MLIHIGRCLSVYIYFYRTVYPESTLRFTKYKLPRQLALASLHYSSAQLFSCCSTTIAFVDISETSIRIRLLCPHYIRGMRLSPKDYLLSRLVCCFTKVTMVYQGCLWPHTTITMPLYLLHTYVYIYMPRSSDRTHPLWLWGRSCKMIITFHFIAALPLSRLAA